MSTPSQLLLVGGFSEIIEICEAQNIKLVGVIDNNLSGTYCGYPVLGNDNDAAKILALHPDIPVHISPDQPSLRTKIFTYYARLGAQFATLRHPSATLAPSAKLGDGCVMHAGASISSFSILGRGVKVNTSANVTHDVTVQDFVSIAPGAVVLSRCILGEGAYIGGNSTILPEVYVGARAIVGAGSVVTRDVPDGAIVYGNPARIQ
jgi:sugar O-acyltransferase (sialic acid O-acetyltransferase NeuD family)